jgi:hypothetical protein
MDFNIRRIDEKDGDGYWILYEFGKFSKPIALFYDYQLQNLLKSIKEQEKNKT